MLLPADTADNEPEAKTTLYFEDRVIGMWMYLPMRCPVLCSRIQLPGSAISLRLKYAMSSTKIQYRVSSDTALACAPAWPSAYSYLPTCLLWDSW
eukprot:3941399-Rhodomonas_salina.9